MDTQPLFGEESKEQKFAVTAGTFATVSWVIYCAVIGVVFGIVKGHLTHLLFGAFIVLFAAIPYFLFKWYRNDDLEGKFKWLTLWAFITLWFAGIIINLYVWTDKPFVVPCAAGDFVIYNATGSPSCWPMCGSGTCFEFSNMTCVPCLNCTGGGGYSFAYPYF